MEHAERIRIAKEIVSRMQDKYGKDILAGGLFGSTSRNEDKAFSDIELIFIVKDSSKAKTREFLLKDVEVSIDVEKIIDVKKAIDNIDDYWPLRVSRLVDFQLMCGSRKTQQELRQRVIGLPDKKFRGALEPHVLSIVGLLNKVRNAHLSKSLPDAIEYVRETLYDINLHLALLNRRYFSRNYYQNFVEAYSFKKLPKDYKRLCEALWLSKDIDEIRRLSQELVGNYITLMKSEGITVKSVKSLDEVKF